MQFVQVNFVFKRLVNGQFTSDVAPFLWIEVKLTTKDFNCSFPYSNKYRTNEVELLWPRKSLHLAKEIIEFKWQSTCKITGRK